MDLGNFSLTCFVWEALGAALVTGAQPRLDLHVVQGAPAAVRVPRAQALLAGRVLLTGLHGHPGHLQGTHTHSGLLCPPSQSSPRAC